MSERLTNQELFEALEIAQGMRSMKLMAAIAELRERRSADLTDEERDALEWVRLVVRRINTGMLGHVRAIDTLDRLLDQTRSAKP
jgi:hypothetical protein